MRRATDPGTSVHPAFGSQATVPKILFRELARICIVAAPDSFVAVPERHSLLPRFFYCAAKRCAAKSHEAKKESAL
jgi:hypothetical protein